MLDLIIRCIEGLGTVMCYIGIIGLIQVPFIAILFACKPELLDIVKREFKKQ